MKILFLHNRYLQPGGEDSAVRSEIALLQSRGHQVRLLEAFNSEIEGTFGKLKTGCGALYSMPWKHRIERQLEQFSPELVHVHNFFPLLSPSIYDACRSKGVPVVQTLHNYRLGCLNAQFFREGRVCEDCLSQSLPWPGVLRRCYHGSLSQSAAIAAMLSLHRSRGTWRERVDAFIALTDFQREKMIRIGLPAERIHLKPNFAFDFKEPGRVKPGEFLLFVGRLSEEKGVEVLLEAYLKGGLDMPLRIVGDGPLRPSLQRRLRQEKLEDRIHLLGSRSPDEIGELMRDARLLLFPSIWYEGLPMVLVEAFSNSLPTIASRIGGLPELLAEGTNGWLVEPGDPLAWARAIRSAWGDPAGLGQRGKAARNSFERLYAPEPAYLRQLQIYEAALRSRSA